MAPFIQPRSLYASALRAVSDTVEDACLDIFLEHGCYGNEECLRAIGQLQDYLVAQLPVTVFEHLAENRNSRYRTLSSFWSVDARIKLAVFFHPCVTRFSVDGNDSETIAIAHHHDDDSSLDEFFWCAQIRRMCNLVHLNLNLVTTDEILLSVGLSCPNLETINIVSRIKQDNSYETHGHLVTSVYLKFCVTDFGLRALLKCRKLRRITMNKVISHSLAVLSITLAGIQTLVEGLPNLEYINYGCMGKVLQANNFEPSSPLKLTYFSERDMTFVDVSKLQRTCPHITHISLCVTVMMTNSGLSSGILTALADSDLPITTLELYNFTFKEPFRQLLRNKGSPLEALTFAGFEEINSTHVVFIGEHCPHLQHIQLKEIGAEDTPYGVFSTEMQSKKLFLNLRNVHLSSRSWNPSIILPLLLAAAKKVSHITVMNSVQPMSMDSAFLRILQFNKLTEVKTIRLVSGCVLSKTMIRRLAFECPQLTSLCLWLVDGDHFHDMGSLQNEIKEKNLDLELNSLCGYEI